MRAMVMALGVCAWLAGCGVWEPADDESISYLLDAVVPEQTARGGTEALAIARPAMPSYLDRQQLVARAAGGQVRMNNYHLWAEPLDAGVSRVLAINLGRLTGSRDIQPVESFVTVDYDRLLEIRISRFEPDGAGDLVLECTWKLQPVRGRVAEMRAFRTRVAAEEPASAAAPRTTHVAAMNEALARLARAITRELE